MADVVRSWQGCFFGWCCEQLAGIFSMAGVVISWQGCFL